MNVLRRGGRARDRYRVFPSSSSLKTALSERRERCSLFQTCLFLLFFTLVGLIVSIAVISQLDSIADANFECERGKWCLNRHLKYPCRAGTYGETLNEVNENCTGTCSAGFYCPKGSTRPDEFICPKGSYCPEASGQPLSCPTGTFGSTEGLKNAECSGNCSAGYYCPEGSASSTAVICPIGNYCPPGTGSPLPCPEGFYGEETGLSQPQCSGVCDAQEGMYCKSGSTKKNQLVPCSIGSFCDGSTGWTQRQDCPAGRFGNRQAETQESCAGECEEGFYCAPGSNSSRAEICPKGHYCPRATLNPLPCPAGRFGETVGQVDPFCEGDCSEGFWCPEGSTSAEASPCPAGYFCPRATTNYSENRCWPGYACPEGTGGPTIPCARGHYCPEGTQSASQFPCPPGFWAGTEGNVNCTSICPAGYFCQVGTANPFNNICPPGRFCPNGTTSSDDFLCPGGGFSSVSGRQSEEECFCDPITDPQCVDRGWCEKKYYCPEGSTSGREVKCPPNYYCPGNTSEPILCQEAGYYCPERSYSPMQQKNEVYVFLLNNIELRALAWQADNPAVAMRYMSQGRTLVEAFLFDINRSTYLGKLYDGIFFEVERGVDTIVANITLRGFFNASVGICDSGSELDASESETRIVDLANLTRTLNLDGKSEAFEVFQVSWSIPRFISAVNMTVCLTFPSGNSTIQLFSDVFGVKPPGQVLPVHRLVFKVEFAFFCLAWIPITLYYGFWADRSRDKEVHELVRPSPPQLHQRVYWTMMAVQMAQFLCLVLWHPAVIPRQDPFWLALFVLVHLLALHWIPLFGYLAVLGIGAAFGLTLWILKKKHGKGKLGRWKVPIELIQWQGLLVPTLLLLWAPLNCGYTNPSNEYLHFEFMDQVTVFGRDSMICWQDGWHISLSGLGALLGMFVFCKAAQVARSEKEEALQVVRVMPFFRVARVSCQTLLCFFYSTISPETGFLQLKIYLGLVFLLCAYTTHKYVRYLPALGRQVHANTFFVLEGSLIGFAVLTSFVVTVLEERDRGNGSLIGAILMLVGVACSLGLVGVLAFRRASALVRDTNFVQLAQGPSRQTREFVCNVALDFLLSAYVDEAKMEKDQTKVQVFVQVFLDSLGVLSQNRKDPVTSLYCKRAVCNLLRSNQTSQVFCIRKAFLTRDAPRAAPLLQTREGPAVRLVGEPLQMLPFCFANLSELNLADSSLDDDTAFLLAKILPTLDKLHAVNLDENPDISGQGFVKLVESVGKSTSMMHFSFACSSCSLALEFPLVVVNVFVHRLEKRMEDHMLVPITQFKFGPDLKLSVVLGERGRNSMFGATPTTPVFPSSPPVVNSITKAQETRQDEATAEATEGIGLLEKEHAILSRHGIVQSVVVRSRTRAPNHEAEEALYQVLNQLSVEMRRVAPSVLIDLRTGLSTPVSRVIMEQKREFQIGQVQVGWLSASVDQVVDIDLSAFKDLSQEHIDLVAALMWSQIRVARVVFPLHSSCMTSEAANQLGQAASFCISVTHAKKELNLRQVRLWQKDISLEKVFFPPVPEGKSYELIEFIDDDALDDLEMSFIVPVLVRSMELSSKHNVKMAFHSTDLKHSLRRDGAVALFSAIGSCPSLLNRLVKLEFGTWASGNQLDDKVCETLAQLLAGGKLNALKSLCLRNCGMSETGTAMVLKGLETFWESSGLDGFNVNRIQMSQNIVRGHACKSLAKLLAEGAPVHKLSLGACRLDEPALQALCDGMRSDKCSLKHLLLDGNPIRSELSLHELMKSCSKLCSLSLVNCELTDIAPVAAFIADKEKSAALVSLNLSHNKNMFLVDLCSALSSNQALEELRLQNCGLDDSHIVSVSEDIFTRPHPSLAVLDLSENAVTDVGCLAIVNALDLRVNAKTSSPFACLGLRLNPGITKDAKHALCRVCDHAFLIDF